jgi:GH25 family lysozyme M1 (1,4-beta-N-acetylmuramidase)
VSYPALGRAATVIAAYLAMGAAGVGLGLPPSVLVPAGARAGAVPATFPAPTVPGGGGTPHAGRASAGGARPSQPNQRQAATAPLSAFPTRGIDVSAYQPGVNWSSVGAAGAKFAYVKATEGTTYVNPYFSVQYHGAKDHGLFAGAYVFARPDAPNAVAQADYFLAHAQYGHDGRTLPLMLDLEWPYSGTGIASACWGLTPTAMVRWVRAFVDRVRVRTGRPMLIYTVPSWWNPCTGNSTAFGDQWLNIAYWNTTSPTVLPAGWSKWTFWQYAASGALPGDQDVFNGGLSGLSALAGPAGPGVTSPVVVSPSAGLVDVYFKGADGALWRKSNSRTGWKWSAAINSGVLGGAPAIVAQASGTVDGFWRGTDGGLWHMWNVGNRWYGPESFGGVLRGDPTAVQSGQGIDVFYLAADGTLFDKAFANRSWQAARELNMGHLSHPPHALSGNGSVALFWRGDDGRLWHTLRSATWAPARSLGGSSISEPAPVRTAPGVTDVFFGGNDGSLSHVWQVGTQWFGPQSLGGSPLGSGPAAVGQTNGVVDVFWRGNDEGLWHKWYVSSRWYGPASLGGRLDTAPAAAVQTTGVIDVFYNDFTRALGHHWFIAGRWYGPVSEGGFLA